MLAISSNLVWPLQFCVSSSCRYYVYVHMARMGGPFLQEGVQSHDRINKWTWGPNIHWSGGGGGEGVQLYSDTGVNVLLISTSVKGASHTYSHLSSRLSAWLAKAYRNMASMASTMDCMLAILLSLHL